MPKPMRSEIRADYPPAVRDGVDPAAGEMVAQADGHIDVNAQLISLEPGLFSVTMFAPREVRTIGGMVLPCLRLDPLPADGLARAYVSSMSESPLLTPSAPPLYVRVAGGRTSLLLTTYKASGPMPPPEIHIGIVEPPAPRAPAPAPAPEPVDALASAGLRVMVHVQNHGDLQFAGGAWAAADDDAAIEGFAIALGSDLPPDAIEYRAVLGQDWFSPWMEDGEFCGSRQMALPLLGVIVRLRGGGGGGASLPGLGPVWRGRAWAVRGRRAVPGGWAAADRAAGGDRVEGAGEGRGETAGPASVNRVAQKAGRAIKIVPTGPPRGRLLANPARVESKPSAARHAIEAVVIARDGGVMIVGWVDDQDFPIDAITVTCGGWLVIFDAGSLARLRRRDVEAALPDAPGYAFGFFGVIAAPGLDDGADHAEIDILLANGGHLLSDVPTRIVGAAALRDTALGYLAAAQFFGDQQAEAAASLEPGLGLQLVALNQAITKRIVAARCIERFGTPRRQPVASIVVCLYGRAEFLFVQNALFAGRPGIGDYEFIFVLNSPEIAEEAVREARLAHRIYGLNQSVVLLPGNAGFGAANNAGVAAARSQRIVTLNPDVFPLHEDWAARHTALVASRPVQQTQLFGVPLYYDNGALMHGGMYFELDQVASIHAGSIERRRLLRVEHYGKGAPDGATSYTRSRPVPAVTGAFISTDRAWYERLGGFTEDYVFGHYEDADLCLKSLELGTPAWMHDIRLWHLEGKGSTRLPHHEGGSLVNRWLFSRTWLPAVSAGLLGPAPTSKAMALPG